MCRLFGFRSVINSQVHSSLIQAENALVTLSDQHPDGWGVAFYRERTPHLIKSVDKAMDDQIFKKVSGVVSSQTVVAHIRKATQGDLNILNSHPFQYGKWIFVHNGNLKNFDQYKNKLIEKIDVGLRPFVLGSTDSELVFYLLLSFLKEKIALSEENFPAEHLKSAIESTVNFITDFSGPLYGGTKSAPQENHLTMLITNGSHMMALSGGQDIHYSTYKTACGERDTCPYYSNFCEAPAEKLGEKINHLIFSSEPLKGENIWTQLEKGQLIGVDHEMRLRRQKLNLDFTK